MSRIDEIRARLDAATPGPWEVREVAHEATPWSKRRVYRAEIIQPGYTHGRRTHSRLICQIIDYCDWTDHPGNAALLSHAPADIAYLLSENERLEGLLAELKPHLDELIGCTHIAETIHRFAADQIELEKAAASESARAALEAIKEKLG